MNGSTAAGQAGMAASRGASSSSSVGKQPQLQVMIKGKERAAVVGLFSPPASMSRNRTMPVTRDEYEAVPDWKLHCLCSENGLPSPIKSQLGGFCF